ncbi:MAG: peptidoglycan-binding protein [Candidatus Excrementavichristensenella sp.]|jgi:hypothetical protein
MFCSHCGKTVDPLIERCPHCGEALGDSKLSGHTSVQHRVLPSETAGEGAARAVTYTKTSYTAEMDPGADVYSRTAYRPLLAEDEPDKVPPDAKPEPLEGSEPEQTSEPEGTDPQLDALLAAAEPAELDDAQKAALKELSHVPENAPPPEEAAEILRIQTGVSSTPLKPVRKKGISPEVENYMKRMEASKGKRAGRRSSEAEDDELSSPAPEGLPEAEDEEARPRARKSADSRTRRVMKRILASLLILGVIGGGLVYLAYITQPKSQIDGVTGDLFTAGTALARSRLGAEYRQKVLDLYASETMATDVPAQREADRAEIQALMPNNPRENDQLFIDTLMDIQDAVDEATETDALAAMMSGDSTLSAAVDSSEDWATITNYVTRLEIATNVTELGGISRGVKEVTATPSPTPTPEPDRYATLSKGSKGVKVKELQQRLRALGWFQGNVDGKYGTVTRKAIQQFQQAAGITVTGIADSPTQELIYSDSAPIKSQEAAAPQP